MLVTYIYVVHDLGLALQHGHGHDLASSDLLIDPSMTMQNTVFPFKIVIKAYTIY